MNNIQTKQYTKNTSNIGGAIANTVSPKNEKNFESLSHEVIITSEQCSGTRDNYLYAFGIDNSEEL